jgi:hypothetical protein
MKKSSTFAASYILNGGYVRLYAAGIFYACTLQHIYGFVTPCGALMRPLPLRCRTTGSAEPFLFPAQHTILSVMSYTEKNCLPGEHSTQANRATCESGTQVFNPQTGEIRTTVGTNEQLPADLSISRETRNFLACILSLQYLCSQVTDAITCMYDERQVDGIMNQEYWPAHVALNDVIYRFLGRSIRENIGRNNLTKI